MSDLSEQEAGEADYAGWQGEGEKKGWVMMVTLCSLMPRSFTQLCSSFNCLISCLCEMCFTCIFEFPFGILFMLFNFLYTIPKGRQAAG